MLEVRKLELCDLGVTCSVSNEIAFPDEPFLFLHLPFKLSLFLFLKLLVYLFT